MAKSKLGIFVSLSVVSSSFTESEDDFDQLAAAASRLIDEAEQAHLTPPAQPAGYPYTARRQQQQRQRLWPQNVRSLGLRLRSVKPDYKYLQRQQQDPQPVRLYLSRGGWQRFIAHVITLIET